MRMTTIQVASILFGAVCCAAHLGYAAQDESFPSATAPDRTLARNPPRGTIAILAAGFHDGAPSATGPLADRLRQRGFAVSELTAKQVCDRDALSAERYFLYIIPDCRTYPAAGFEALNAFVAARGQVLFLGGPLGDDPVWWLKDRWVNRQDVLAAKRSARAEHQPFPVTPESARDWTRTTSNPRGGGTWEVVPEGPGDAASFRFSCQNLTGWEGYLSAPIPQLFGPQHDLLTFLAKGGPRTDRLVIEVQEQDGSRWMAVTELTAQWQRIGLEPHDFEYWQDSPTREARGGKGDRLRPDQARRVNFQLAQSHAPTLPQGEHRFWIAQIGTCANPVRDLPLAGSLPDHSLETVFPRYKVYTLSQSLRVAAHAEPAVIAAWEGDLDAGVMMQNLVCAVGRTMGRGFQRGQKWRYVPLLDAADSDGTRLGSPGWLLLHQAPPHAGSVLAGLGFQDPDALATRPVLDAVCTIVERLGQGAFLQEAGTEHFAYWPDEPIELGAAIINVAAVQADVALRVTIRDQEKNAIHVAAPPPFGLASRQPHSWRGTWTPPSSEPAVYTVVTELLRSDRVIDRIVHDVAVLDSRRPDPSEFITVAGNDFLVNGRKWYPVGINYWPLYVSGMDHDDFWAGWLTSAYYEPESVEADLVRMKTLGINLVSIQASDPKYYRNLLDFTRRCARHEIYVNLFCGLASPLAFREQPLRQFIETARLADNPTIMAYDTIWEPGNFVFEGARRAGWDTAWRAWVCEQYGSIESAEADWQYTGRRDHQQRLISPPDEHFREDGPWRVMMAAYRRFMDDLTSRKWNQAHRKLREIDPRHLISFRQGNTLPHDFVFTGTPKHIDFICPEGYSIPHSESGYFAAGFITKYVHFTTRGKPIVWSEFGQSVWDRTTTSPSPARIEQVAEYHELFYRMALETGANGTIPWWWPGGYRVGEQSDYGIVHPNGTPRPAAELIARYGPRLQQDRVWPEPTVWFNMDRDAHAGGYWHVCFHPGAEAYRQASQAGGHLGIRSDGTGTTSANVPRVAVGNRPCDGDNPPKYLNAEFNWLRIRDASGRWVEAEPGATITVRAGTAVHARVSVGNTQEALWLAPQQETHPAPSGSVVLQATETSQLRGTWPIPADTPYLADADFEQIILAAEITASTRVELRMAAVGFAPFGERRAFTLRPAEPD